ncbi:hypothetical protein F511_35260 [Dorcoceras hygrometricum]|uniref:Uncharacterized protein n=1 Tax=Dorcoceras hygrometricum TaxID=472368 RepID=A0A2Z7BT56_9LAMI|nr:hypothetical protein F511_35260 [Dorcoceras hygrometricum]
MLTSEQIPQQKSNSSGQAKKLSLRILISSHLLRFRTLFSSRVRFILRTILSFHISHHIALTDTGQLSPTAPAQDNRSALTKADHHQQLVQRTTAHITEAEQITRPKHRVNCTVPVGGSRYLKLDRTLEIGSGCSVQFMTTKTACDALIAQHLCLEQLATFTAAQLAATVQIMHWPAYTH